MANELMFKFIYQNIAHYIPRHQIVGVCKYGKGLNVLLPPHLPLASVYIQDTDQPQFWAWYFTNIGGESMSTIYDHDTGFVITRFDLHPDIFEFVHFTK